MLPGYTWEDCPLCEGTGNFEYDTNRACMGEGGRWIPLPESEQQTGKPASEKDN